MNSTFRTWPIMAAFCYLLTGCHSTSYQGTKPVGSTMVSNLAVLKKKAGEVSALEMRLKNELLRGDSEIRQTAQEAEKIRQEQIALMSRVTDLDKKAKQSEVRLTALRGAMENKKKLLHEAGCQLADLCKQIALIEQRQKATRPASQEHFQERAPKHNEPLTTLKTVTTEKEMSVRPIVSTDTELRQ